MCLAFPGLIESVDGTEFARTGKVNFGGIVREVNLACVPEAGVGDYVVVHVGVAISRVDKEEAETVLEFLQQMGEEDVKP